MATDATGTPTTLGIPTYNTQVDAPSGKGFNAAMTAIDLLIQNTVTKPSGIVSGEAPIWNGSSFVRSSVTGLTPSGIAGYPADGTKALFGDGAWKVFTTVYDRATTLVDVNTSTTETSIYTKSIAGNDMSTNKMLRLSLIGNFLHNNVAGDTITLRIKFGGTTHFAAVTNLGNAISAGRQPWDLQVLVANLGSASSQFILATGNATRAGTGAPTTGIGDAYPSANTEAMPMEGGVSTLGSINTTSSQTLDITIQWSASSANNSWRMYYGLLELI